MFAAFVNAFKVKELRSRLLFTAGIIVLVRVASNLPCPGVNSGALNQYLTNFSQEAASGGVMAMVNLFTGGALEQFAVATLGIMPYITSSIIMQLLTPVLPSLEKMSRDGESGRQKINQYTRYLTVLICIFQGFLAAAAMADPSRIGLPSPHLPLYVGSQTVFMLMTIIVLTATTMVFMWLGEQVTERGIGNGVSIIITINIIARMPQAVTQLVEMTISGQTMSGATFKPVQLLLLFAVFIAVTAATILLTQGYRRVPIQMVRKTIGTQVMGGSTYMPLKVNFANVMPIIFAGAIMMVPGPLFNGLAQFTKGRDWSGASDFFLSLGTLFRYHSTGYMVLYGLLIMGFSYFWVASQFNPIQISENLKRDGAYIPGIRPGQPTADFLDQTMTRVTFGGAVFLTALALFPMILATPIFGIDFLVASFFGGTSLLIMVGVVLDTMSQMESHLTMRNYDGFLKSGRLRGRNAIQ
ncbi:preprotein translocase subunit SecY [Victivallis sp. Marseille-Q1083]|uniref:preprotein translocase subunit SecY n=1 Tax=Victivallis sp. Marseille-Q1083 TaxID=2717288 RepID=UPI00158B3331|nr:preprotein translocase subunit SecY [Victivallis sp. Marseille-Q1083]